MRLGEAVVRRMVLLVAFFLAVLTYCATREAVQINEIEIEVSNIQRASDFYTGVLGFQEIDNFRGQNGVPFRRLRLGRERLILRESSHTGDKSAWTLKSNDLGFQHLALVVSDVDRAYAILVAHHVSIISRGVQTLPAWNRPVAGIRALYFRDPDGHYLELIEFPKYRGEPRWQSKSDLFLGIDHTAIVVADTTRSLRFYHDVAGFTIAAKNLNQGPEQEHLSGIPGAKVKISSLRGAREPGIELLQYESPSPRDASATEQGVTGQWRVRVQGMIASSKNQEHEITDPYGHSLIRDSSSKRDSEASLPWQTFQDHWCRYVMDGAELGLFMAMALFLTLVAEHPRSLLRKKINSPLLRRSFVGLGIGGTVTGIMYSPWGYQSGAYLNPAVVLALLDLRKIQPWDAFFFIFAQFLGGWLGLELASLPFRRASSHEKVRFVATLPPPGKPGVALVAELAISAGLMLTSLYVNQNDVARPWIGWVLGVLLFLYITFESPFSGMSLNPARSVASAIPAHEWSGMWVYFLAPIAGMMIAARLWAWENI